MDYKETLRNLLKERLNADSPNTYQKYFNEGVIEGIVLSRIALAQNEEQEAEKYKQQQKVVRDMMFFYIINGLQGLIWARENQDNKYFNDQKEALDKVYLLAVDVYGRDFANELFIEAKSKVAYTIISDVVFG